MGDAKMEHGKKKVKKRGRSAVFWLLTFLILMVIFLVCAQWSYRYVIESATERAEGTPITIAPQEGISVDIPLGSGTESIAKILKDKGIIRYPFIFKIISKFEGYDGYYKSGVHILKKGLTYQQIMKILTANPERSPSVKVTIPEGYTYKQIADLLAKKGVVDREKFDEVANNYDFDFDFIDDIPEGRKYRLEGYLFPDTYEFDPKAGEAAAIKKMLTRFNEMITESEYKRMEKLGMTLDEVIIIASLIEREAKVSSERPIISGVIHNRLNSKDPSMRKLQIDATIQYIFLNEQGSVKEVLLTEDTKIDHPYNTYKHEGLPPGPISSPGEDSIRAALYPEGDYLFYVQKEDGTGEHYFTKTYDEHLSAMDKANKNKQSKE
ncbi:endolytic transglycosylase MltG [Clostridium thermosuccinogenes]|jgi:UPF0755 protein|uniref:endolytic transglycosylase MltG n=1 Tax=Clostridium thermosuccinogenes TaxID=84032 RepID=UPI000CCC2297|nr:endolytic transglycosylase MltG [Pseudoclostridium thermosuccinogenes]PNT93291.1 hypothetical protein CDQ83_07175 [Pseudoclostridium thermosuccinogenes]